ncbi:MAG: fimbrillin family protein [Bacteroidaceae bacterium]|nr:fimbrillin family protein [Bacteroidaceae bacterium]
MKKYLFMALAAFAFVSCSNEFDANEGAATTAKGKRIEYNVYAGAASRGTIIGNIDSLQVHGDGYYVWANYYNGTTDTTTKVTEEIVWNKTESKWGTSGFFWPAEDISFYFFAPQNALSLNNSALKKAEYLYSQPAAAGNQIDILYGTPQVDKNSATGTVNVTLTHVMSHITFKVKSGPNNTTGVQVSSIAFRGLLPTSGTMDFKATAAANFWKNDTVMQDTVYRPGTIATPILDKDNFTNVIQPGQDLFIIPSKATNITVEVNFTAESRNWTKSVDIPGQEFAIGNSYEIRLTLDADRIQYSVATVDPWGTPTTL